MMTDAEKKLLQAQHRLEEAQARDRVKERKARTRRLIQEGAILEKVLPEVRTMEPTVYMRDGIISHANHYKHPHMPRPPYRQMDIYPKDELRSFRLDYLVENLHGNELGIRDIMEILSDHGVNYPASICQHLPECATNFSTVTDLNKKEMYIATGNPCGGYIFVRPFEE